MRQPLTLNPLLRIATKRTRSGQALVLMAAAMIVLIAFVGIATDISLLFVRYNALRRAVDAASIAVAGQVRTGVDFAQLNNVARQFVQLQGGINPDTVKVETCETDIDDYVTAYRTQFGPAAPAVIPPDVSAGDTTMFRPLNHVITGTGQLYTMYPTRPKSELCKFDPQKLVRVSAQLRSETVFLTLLGWKEVTLSVSTVSQTAVLDVALVIDNSSSMSDDTITDETNWDKYPCSTIPQASCNANSTYQGRVSSTGDAVDLYDTNYQALLNFKQLTNAPTAATDPGFSLRPARAITIPSPEPLSSDVGQYNNNVDVAAFNAQKAVNANDTAVSLPTPASVADLTIRAECMYNPQFLAAGWDNGIPRGLVANKMGNYGWGGCCNDPTIQSNPPLSSNPVGYMQYPTEGNAQTSTMLAFNNGASPDWYLYDDSVSPQSQIGITGSYTNLTGDPNMPASSARRIRAGDYVTYDANDAHIKNNGDGNFSDLICQPFRQVRDAARRFIKRLDFVRGDRLALITFSENGQVVCPTYASEFRNDAYDAACAGDPFIYDKDLAVRTLNFKVGVVHNWGKNVGWQENCRSQQAQYNPTSPRTVNYWVISQCQNTNTGGAIAVARSVLKDVKYMRREAVWVMVMLSDGYANRTPAIGTADVLGRFDTQALRDWNEVPVTERPDTSAFGTVTAAEVTQYCSYWDPTANGGAGAMTTGLGGRYLPVIRYDGSRCDPNYNGLLRTYFGYGGATDAQITDRCLKYGSKPQLCANWYATGSASSEPYSYGYCPWSDFCLNPADTKVSPRADQLQPGYLTTFQFPQQCFRAPVTTNASGQVSVGAQPDLENPPAWNLAGNPPYTPYCADNDPDSRHFCANSLGWINAYDEDVNNNKNPDEQTSSASLACSKYYDADDYARDEADWAGLIQYTDRTPGDFIAMFTIFFAKKTTTGAERDLGENILGVKLMRYISDAGDNGRIDNNLQEFYRHFRGDLGLAADPNTFVQGQGVASYNGRQFMQYKNGTGVYNANGTFKNWMDQDQDECSQWDYNEYNTSGGYRTVFPGQTAYEDIARRDCGQYWFANDISKVNRAFTEIAGRLFTRLAR